MGRDARANEQRREAIRAEFGKQINEGTRAPVDRFGQPILKGDLVVYRHMGHDLIYEILDVKPVLDPRIPPGMVDVILAVQFPVRIVANQLQMQFITVKRPESAPPPKAEPLIALTDQHAPAVEEPEPSVGDAPIDTAEPVGDTPEA